MTSPEAEVWRRRVGMCKGPVAGDSLPALEPENIGVKGLGAQLEGRHRGGDAHPPRGLLLPGYGH